jgi:hypothetical protein
VEFSLSADSWWSRGEVPCRTLAVEIMAQALLAELSSSSDGGEGRTLGESTAFLAGLEGISWERDLQVGRRLSIQATHEANFGRLHRFHVSLLDERGVVASGKILVGL